MSFVVDPWTDADKRVVPTRLRIVHYYPTDKLVLRLTLTDGEGNPVDVTNSQFPTTIEAVGVSDAPEPTVDLSRADLGQVYFRWSKAQVALLPSSFVLAIGENGGGEELDSDSTWDDLDPNVTFDEYPDVTWEDSAIWGRTLFLWPLVRNDRGR